MFKWSGKDIWKNYKYNKFHLWEFLLKLIRQDASNTSYYYLHNRTGNFKLLYRLQCFHDNWEPVCKLEKGNIFTVMVNKGNTCFILQITKEFMRMKLVGSYASCQLAISVFSCCSWILKINFYIHKSYNNHF
jgi:hypothetical protein